jgi:hypothetical protein
VHRARAAGQFHTSAVFDLAKEIVSNFGNQAFHKPANPDARAHRTALTVQRARNVRQSKLTTLLIRGDLDLVVTLGPIDDERDQPADGKDPDDDVSERAQIVVDRPDRAPEAAAV